MNSVDIEPPQTAEDQKPPQTAEDQKSLKMNVAAYLISVCAVALPGAAYGIASYAPEIEKVAGLTSDSEDFINDSLHNSVLDKKAWFDCDAVFLKTPEGTRYGYTTVVEFPVIGKVTIMHMPQQLCDAIVDYSRSGDKSNFTDIQHSAIETAVHEAEHIQRDELSTRPDEARVTCAQIQTMPLFAQELGATLAEADQLQRQSIGRYLLGKPARFQSLECKDGGLYDLNKDQPGNFPH